MWVLGFELRSYAHVARTLLTRQSPQSHDVRLKDFCPLQKNLKKSELMVLQLRPATVKVTLVSTNYQIQAIIP